MPSIAVLSELKTYTELLLSECLPCLSDCTQSSLGDWLPKLKTGKWVLVLLVFSHWVLLITLCWVTELSLLRLFSPLPGRYQLSPFFHLCQTDYQPTELVPLSSLNCPQTCSFWWAIFKQLTPSKSALLWRTHHQAFSSTADRYVSDAAYFMVPVYKHGNATSTPTKLL